MGLETTKDLVKQGYTVYGGARHTDKIEKAGAHSLKMNMADYASLEKGVNQIIKEQGKIDVLWNNAGFGLYGAVEDTPIDTAKYQFEVNLFGLARLTQLVTPHMRKKKSGLIINTSSMGGKIYFPLGAWYHATKHALEGFSDCLRLELKQFGIKVVILEPGAIDTNFGEVFMEHFNKLPKNSAYKSLMDGYRNMDMSSMKASPSSLISETIQKIISSDKPKRRYLVGSMAKPTVYMRKWLGDAYLDNMMLKMVKPK